MQLVSKVVVAFAWLLFAVQAPEALYRYRLFSTYYARQPFINHVGDFEFYALYGANGAALICSAIAAILLAQKSSKWWVIAAAAGTLNLITWIAIIYMHRTGMLVTYMEFIRHMKGMP